MSPYRRHESWSDHELAAAHLAGDPDAFAELCRRFRPRLVALIRHRVPDEATAQDTAQDALLRALQNLEAYDMSRPLWPWLRRIALNSLIDSQRRVPVPVDPSGLEEPQLGADPAAEACDRSVLTTAMQSLPVRQRAALHLRYVEDLDSSTAAAVMSLRRGAYDQLLYRARRALVQRCRELGFTERLGALLPLWLGAAGLVRRARGRVATVGAAELPSLIPGAAEAMAFVVGIATIAALTAPMALPPPQTSRALASEALVGPANGLVDVARLPARRSTARSRPSRGTVWGADATLAQGSAGTTLTTSSARRPEEIRTRSSQRAQIGGVVVEWESDDGVDCTSGTTGQAACALADATTSLTEGTVSQLARALRP